MTDRSRKSRLRTGWTTGTCASAAAKAATLGLVTGTIPNEIEVALPSSARVRFAVEAVGATSAVVVKYAGDDPDCTDGARVTATAAPGPTGEESSGLLRLFAGDGVGTVTRPGLGLPVGGPAINPVPRRMIEQAVREVTPAPLDITFSVPGGQQMAAKTTNARLGILGGISILGTTGIVRPFSTAAFRASVVQQIDVAAAAGLTRIALCTGTRTERAALVLFPEIELVGVVEVGDYSGVAVRRAGSAGIARAEMVAMAGKIAKLAGGAMMTHFHRGNVPTELLAEVATAAGASASLVGAAQATNTARYFFDACQSEGDLSPWFRLCEMAAANLAAHAGNRVRVRVHLSDYESNVVVTGSWK
jgi:cobalt-precorrin-5B (C1)-methyltransferase